MSVYKAGREYWDKTWEDNVVPIEINPRDSRLGNYVNWRFHEYFRRIFSGMGVQQGKILEIGCARSVWLPYFAREFGFEVYGVDYSEVGCCQAKKILESEGVNGTIVCADFFSPPGSMLKAFDVAVSFGVLEHFNDSAGCIAAFSAFLKPGGLLITSIPNLCGLNGTIQRIVNRTILDIHVPLKKNAFMQAHQVNGLKVISCEYFLFINLGVVNVENLKDSFGYKAARLRSWINEAVWMVERAIPWVKPNAWSSPYINCVAVKL